MKSMASSIQPSCAATSVRHCWRVISRCHGIGLTKVLGNGVRVGSAREAGPGGRCFALGFPFIIKKFQFIFCVKWRIGGVTFRAGTAPTSKQLMSLNRIHTRLGRLLAAWIAVAGLMAAEHHGTIKFGGLPVPGATVTASKGDKKLATTTDENGRYAFADLSDGAWTIEVEMLGFAKLSNEVGVAFDAPAPEWNLKFLPMSAIMAPPAAPSATPAKPADAASTPPAGTPAAVTPPVTNQAADAAPKPAATAA